MYYMFIMSYTNHRNYRMLLVPRSCAVTQTPLRIPFKSLFDSTRAAPWTGCWDTVDPKVSEKNMGNTWKHHLLTRFWLLLWFFPNGFDTCWCFSGDFQTEMCSKREVAFNDDCWIHDSATPCKPTLKFKKCASFVLCRLSHHSNRAFGTTHIIVLKTSDAWNRMSLPAAIFLIHFWWSPRKSSLSGVGWLSRTRTSTSPKIMNYGLGSESVGLQQVTIASRSAKSARPMLIFPELRAVWVWSCGRSCCVRHLCMWP